MICCPSPRPAEHAIRDIDQRGSTRLLAALILTAATLLTSPAGATLPGRGVGSGCSEAPRCAARVVVAGDSATLNLTGLVATGALLVEEPQYVQLKWATVALSGTLSGHGAASLTIDPGRTSHVEPDC